MKKWLSAHRAGICYVAVVLLALALRLYKMPDIPRDICLDEMGLAYNAFSVANYGVGRDLTPMPLYFANFYGGQSALATYAVAILFKLLGVSIFALRLPWVAFSMMVLVFGTLIIRQAMGEKAGLVGALLLGIVPVFVMQGRWALDCNALPGVMALALYLLVLAVKKQKLWLFVLAGAGLGLSLYAYMLNYITGAIFCVLIAAYLLWTRAADIKRLAAYAGGVLLLGWPHVLMVALNALGLPSLRIGPFTIPAGEAFGGRMSNLGFNPGQNIQMAFNAALFRQGGIWDGFAGHYTLYLVSIPFALLGLGLVFKQVVISIKSRKYSIDSVMFIWLVCVFILAVFLGQPGPNVQRLNSMYLCWVYVLVVGIRHVWRLVGRRRWYAAAMAAAYGVSFVAFAQYYFVQYPVVDYPQSEFRPNVVNVSRYLDEINIYDKDVYFTSAASKLYYGLANGISPYESDFLLDNSFDETEPLDGNTYFYWPGEEGLDADAWYVVWVCDYEYQEILNEAGFKASFDDGLYRLYQTEVWPPWAEEK